MSHHECLYSAPQQELGQYPVRNANHGSSTQNVGLQMCIPKFSKHPYMSSEIQTVPISTFYYSYSLNNRRMSCTAFMSYKEL